MLKHFEEFDGATEKAGKWLEWLLLEIWKHNIKHPVTSRLIKVMTHKKEWVEQKDGATKFVETSGLAGTEVRAMVHFLRSEGYPIGSRGAGYYWIMTEKDRQVTIDHLDGRISSMSRARDGVANADLRKSPTKTLDVSLVTSGDLFNG